MNAFWQKIFLTVGILIAVFGMRLVFPLLIVAITAKLSPVEAVKLALERPRRATRHWSPDAHPAIAAFGGMFLLMIFLDFIFEERDIKWLGWLERPLAKLGKLDMLSVVIALVVLVVARDDGGHRRRARRPVTRSPRSCSPGSRADHVPRRRRRLGSSRTSSRTRTRTSDEADARRPRRRPRRQGRPALVVGLAGKAAFFLFLYLEVLDASFSFDGVIGAFAITNDIFVIALGLGIGAMYIRSLTVYLVRKGTLDDYVYLEHGAHYAIGALAVILLVSIKYEIPEVVTGLVGVALIGLVLRSVGDPQPARGQTGRFARERSRKSPAECDATLIEERSLRGGPEVQTSGRPAVMWGLAMGWATCRSWGTCGVVARRSSTSTAAGRRMSSS